MTKVQVLTVGSEEGVRAAYDKMGIPIGQEVLDLLAGDPPRYPHVPGDFKRHPETGAPYVNHPTETRRDGTPKRVMYGRPSSFGAALDNPFNLVKWKERQLLIGCSILGVGVNDEDYDNRELLDGLAARCHDAAGSHLAADQGTHIHKLLEHWDKGELLGRLFFDGEQLGIPEVLQKQILTQWAQFRERLGLTALAVEQTVVNDRWRLAGTLDRLDVADHDILTAYGVLEAGQPFVGDIKTGGLTLGNDGQPNYWVKHPVQLAAYVDAVPYDTDTDERRSWFHLAPGAHWHTPDAHIALIYHYDLARALAGEVVDWQAIPVNVDAGREGGDLCRAAADFAKRCDLFAMPAPKYLESHGEIEFLCQPPKSAVPVGPNPAVEQQTADPEPALASCPVPGAAVNLSAEDWEEARSVNGTGQRPTVSGPAVTPLNEQRFWMAWDRACLIARIKDLVDQGHESLIRQWWPEGVPTLKHDGHSDAQLQLILACVRRVEAEVGSGWHPDDGPPPHVNTNPRASIDYPVAAAPDEGGTAKTKDVEALTVAFSYLDTEGMRLCKQVAREANEARRSISLTAFPSVRRWSIARAVIAWAANGRTVDELWLTASTLATFEQCRDPSATLGGLISQFTIEQADRLYETAQQ